MKRRIILVAVAMGLLAMILSPLSVFSQPAKPTPKPIKIGGSLPLTGIFSESGKWVKNGYDFWLEEINKKGGLLGRPVEMTIYDDESAPDKAVT